MRHFSSDVTRILYSRSSLLVSHCGELSVERMIMFPNPLIEERGAVLWSGSIDAQKQLYIDGNRSNFSLMVNLLKSREGILSTNWSDS